jgi:dephospho-CoA kinase
VITIGLTGSIATGKSEVAQIYRQHGLPVFDADRAVHELYDSRQGADLLKPLVPEAVVRERVNRVVLAKLVLADEALLERLEPIIHDEINRRLRKFLEEAQNQGNEVVVADIPLLFETNRDRDFDVTVVVSAPSAQQRQRALARPGMTEEKLAMILRRQMPDSEKRQRANYVIDNDDTLTELKVRALAVLMQIRKDHAH